MASLPLYVGYSPKTKENISVLIRIYKLRVKEDMAWVNLQDQQCESGDIQ